MQSPAQNACLLIGIADYQYIRPLPASVIADVDALRALIASQQLGFYAAEQHLYLTNEAASKAAIQAALAQLAQWATPSSTVLIYISSHGQHLANGVNAGSYLLPVETQVDSDGLIVPETAMSHQEFSHCLRQIKAKRLVVLLDLCHAGGMGEAKDTGQTAYLNGFADRHLSLLAGGSGRVIMAASRANEQSWILHNDHNSLFTKHLLAGLQGNALSVGGVIRVFDLFNYVQPRVTAEKAEQHPIFKAELEENFPIAIVPTASTHTISEQAKAETGFAYDVFVSYCKEVDEDAEWVQNQLIPALKQAGVKVCADSELGCFRLGRPLLTEMQRAVEYSRFTLAVFSPDYLQSGFTELENTMAQFLGAETNDTRFMGLIWRDCKPDLRFRSRLLLNMQVSQEFNANIQRLAYECLH